ncbi:MAG: hypothetical protein ACJA0E_001319 [Bermanella sp.]|jgi:hypothetical protein
MALSSLNFEFEFEVTMLLFHSILICFSSVLFGEHISVPSHDGTHIEPCAHFGYVALQYGVILVYKQHELSLFLIVVL